MLLREVLAASHDGKKQDEKRWLERLQHHIKTNINPLLVATSRSSGINHNDVVRLLTPKFCPPSPLHEHGRAHHLVELEVVTVKHLVVKIAHSFSAANLSNFASREEPLKSTTCPEGELPKAPVVLLGVLTSSLPPSAMQGPFDNGGRRLVYSGLVLADATGKIPCEMAVSCLWVEAIGNVIVATEWNLIHSDNSKGKSGNYVEIQNCKIVQAEGHTIPCQPSSSTFSVSKMNKHIKDKMRQKNSPVSVYGRVSAVSDVTRNGAESLFLVRLAGESASDTSLFIFVQVPALLHFSVLLHVSSCYLFTALKEKVFGKRTPAERTVLSCTEASEIIPFSPPPIKSSGVETSSNTAGTSVNTSFDTAEASFDTAETSSDAAETSSNAAKTSSAKTAATSNDLRHEREGTPPMFTDSPCLKTRQMTEDAPMSQNEDCLSPPPSRKARGREGASTPLLFGGGSSPGGSPPPSRKARGREGASTPLLFGSDDDGGSPPPSRKRGGSGGTSLFATPLQNGARESGRWRTPSLFTTDNGSSPPLCKRAEGSEEVSAPLHNEVRERISKTPLLFGTDDDFSPPLCKRAKGSEGEPMSSPFHSEVKERISKTPLLFATDDGSSPPPCRRARESEGQSTPLLFAAPADSSPPALKRQQREDFSPPLLATGGSFSPALVSSPSKSAKVKNEEQSKAAEPSEKRLVSYQGVVTGCVCPSAGVYELDGRVRLYLTNTMCSNMGRGIRTGVRVQLHNVAVLRVRSDRFKHISGFFCCSLSSLRIVKFSHLNSPYSLFNSRNTLSSLTRRYGLLDRAWLLDVFITLLNREYIVDMKGCFLFLSELSKLVNLQPVEGDFVGEFTSSAHTLFQGSSEVDLALRPSCPSAEAFRAQIMERVSKGGAKGGMRWCRGEDVGRSSGGGSGVGGGGGGSNQCPEVSYVVKTDWEYAVIKASELTQKQILTGVLQGCNRTGSLMLQDTSGTWSMLATIPQQATPLTPPTTPTGNSHILRPSNGIVSSIGNRVILRDYWVVVERTTSQGNGSSTDANLSLYIHPIAFSTLPSSTPVGEGEKPSPSLPHHPSSSDISCSSFLICKDEYSALFLQVLNKNTVMVDPWWGLKFMCTASVHPDLATLTGCRDFETERARGGPEIDERSDENGRRVECVEETERCQGVAEFGQVHGGPIQVAVTFGKGAFKWYSVVRNGYVYKLRRSASDMPLPTWKVLQENLDLTVSDDMVVELVSGRGSGGGCGQDVSDLVKQLMLPPLRSLSPSQETKQRSQLETISLSGIIASRSYRIDHKTLATSGMSSGEASGSKQRRILALTIQSQNSPDTIVAYCEFKETIPIPIGLIPGAKVTLNAFRLKTSKSGNPYLTNFALSSIDVDGLSSVEQMYGNSCIGSTETLRSGALIVPGTFELPVRSLWEMMMSLVDGTLSRASVCVRVSHVTVHRLVMDYKCLGCQCTITNGRCIAACLRRRPTLDISARLMVEDGSGCGHIYVSDGLVREFLATPLAEWRSVCDLVKTIGRVAYVKRSHQFQAAQEVAGRRETASNSANLSDLDRAKNSMCCWANSPSLQRTFKIVCQPFLSREEAERSVLGQRSHTFRMKGSEFSTLSLPRLQLRGVALIELSKGAGFAREGRHLLEKLQF